MPRPPEQLPEWAQLPPGGRWADAESASEPGAAAAPARPVECAEAEYFDIIGLILGVEKVLKNGGWPAVRIAAMPLGISMRAPRRKVVKRIVQRWLGLQPERLRRLALSVARMESRLYGDHEASVSEASSVHARPARWPQF